MIIAVAFRYKRFTITATTIIIPIIIIIIIDHAKIVCKFFKW